MAGVRVRLARPADAAVVTGLVGEFRDHLGRSRPDDAQLRASVERLIAAEDCEYLLGGAGAGEAVGVCQLRFRFGLWHGAYDCWLEDLFVRPASRRAGVGAALVQTALDRASSRGCARVELDTDAANEAALSLYRRFGFSAETPEGDARLFLRRMLTSQQ